MCCYTRQFFLATWKVTGFQVVSYKRSHLLYITLVVCKDNHTASHTTICIQAYSQKGVRASWDAIQQKVDAFVSQNVLGKS